MALDLRYNSPQTGTSLGGAALFNGNISQMMWASTSSAPEQTGSAPEQAGYGFTYDGLNRLRSANYAEGTSYTSGAGKFSTSYSYDANGNMSTLARNLDGNPVDNLVYAYISNGNRLQSVSDGTASPLGYKAVTGSYLYDNNGNMTKDISKGFTITYNSLNLPQLVSSVNDYARYTYDAAGTKLAKTVVTNGTAENILNYRYSGIFLYEGKENLTLTSIFTPEGRIVPQNNGTAMSYSYEYNLKDHLGNTRVTFTGHANGRPEVNQLTSYDPYGLVTSQTSYYPTGASKNKLLYNGKEIQDDVLAGSKIDWFDYGARMYDPQLGRWSTQDPLAEVSRKWSPYSYCYNEPIRFIDPDGMLSYRSERIDKGQSDEDKRRVLDWDAEARRKEFEEAGKVPIWNTVPHFIGEAYGPGDPKNEFKSYVCEQVDVKPAEQGGMPRWTSDVNTGINAFGVANSAKTELIDYVVRNNYKSARTWSEFNNLRSSQQAWRTTNTLGKTGANYLKYAKGLGYVGAGLTTTYSAANAGMYYYNGGTDWQVGTKATLDVIMTGVGFLGPIGFGVSSTYFILDATTGGFGGFGQIKP